uniref:Putative secreted protein n=1 Tax=Amblyomma cajennense TaxID=34607 RepID=A0A023FDY6_AMBCJ
MWTGMPLHEDHRRLAALCATLLLGMLFRCFTQFHPAPPTLLPWPLDLASTSLGPSPLLSHCYTFISLSGWQSSMEHGDGKLSRATVKTKPAAGLGFWEGLMERGACFAKQKKQ